MSISRQKHGLVSAQDFLVMLLQEDRSGGSLVCTGVVAAGQLAKMTFLTSHWPAIG